MEIKTAEEIIRSKCTIRPDPTPSQQDFVDTDIDNVVEAMKEYASQMIEVAEQKFNQNNLRGIKVIGFKGIDEIFLEVKDLINAEK